MSGLEWSLKPLELAYQNSSELANLQGLGATCSHTALKSLSSMLFAIFFRPFRPFEMLFVSYLSVHPYQGRGGNFRGPRDPVVRGPSYSCEALLHLLFSI